MFLPRCSTRPVPPASSRPGCLEECGGGGGDFLHHVILHEEMGYSVAGASMGGGLGIDGSSYLILAGGTEEQKRDVAARYASGETIAEACSTEPQSGSDVAGFRTHAARRRRLRDQRQQDLDHQRQPLHHGSRRLQNRCGRGGQGHEHLPGRRRHAGGARGQAIETLAPRLRQPSRILLRERARQGAIASLGGSEGGGFKQVMGVLNDMRVAEAAAATWRPRSWPSP